MAFDLEGRLRTALKSRYAIERELGHGGMAIVFLAADRKHDRRVALKVLRPELAAALGPERFLREIRVAAQLSHPHIVPLYDSGQAGGFLYYTMPYVEGESLRSRLARDGQLPTAEAVQITREVADALSYAHSLGLVHRDIKPENILLSGGHALVADFGIARALDAAGSEKLTETGLAIGTPAYMSPEQAVGSSRIDGRSDLYSLGCVLYEMLAGHPPFLGSTTQEILARHTLDPVPPLRTARGTVPETVDLAILGALAKLPADRYPTATAFVEALTLAMMMPPDVAPTLGVAIRTPPRRVARLLWLAAALVVLGATYALFFHGLPFGTAGAAARSIAVLPFDNIGGDTSNEYFSDGISEELITALQKLPGLHVVSRTSSFMFKHKSVNPREIAKTLNVGTLLVGTVRRSGRRIRVSAHLTDPQTGYDRWAEVYEREAQDVFATEDEIARAIVNALRISLVHEPGTPLVASATLSSEAHDLYLRGRFFFAQRTEEGLRRAVQAFEEAIARDSSYAVAHSGLSDVYSVSAIYGYVPTREAFARARAAALRALQLDSTLAEAYTSLGIVSWWGEWNRSAAERDLRKAIALGPQYAPAHLFYAWYFATGGQSTDAVREIEQARQLDPLSVIINTRVASMLYFARRYPEAIAQLLRTLELDSTSTMAHAELARAYMAQERCNEALAAIRPIPASFSNYEGEIVGYTYAACGRRDDAMRVVRELETLSSTDEVVDMKLAAIYAGLGERDAAFARLGRVSAAGARQWLSFVNIDPAFDPLRGDSRYAPLMRRIGLHS